MKKDMLLSDILDKYCSMLTPYFGITNLGYIKIYFDSRYFYATNNIDLQDAYIDKVHETVIFLDDAIPILDSDYSLLVWPQDNRHHSLDLYHKYDYVHGCALAKQNADNLEQWWFATSKSNENINSWFLKNMQFLLKFTYHIKTQHADYFTPEACKPVFHYKNKCNFSNFFQQVSDLDKEKQKLSDFYQEHMNAHIVIKDNQKIKIGNREFECLTHLKNGYSVKHIAKNLGISNRTAEYYLNRLKEKVGVNYKNEVLKFFETQKHLWW